MVHNETALLLANRQLQHDYWQIDLQLPRIVPEVQPGQFVHIRLPAFEHRVLRRPFSIYNVDPDSGRLSVIYKIVGEGTFHLSRVPVGTEMAVMGPLGNGYDLTAATSSSSSSAVPPVIVAGGYGCAATYLLARRCRGRCVCLLGARAAADVLLTAEFAATGAEVQLSTDDGSMGHNGRVTELLAPILAKPGALPPIFACGPAPMLKAVGEMALAHGVDAQLSLDHAMCCGVGACFACVVKVKAATAEGWRYARTCSEGPVFRASDVVW